jgi:hypothetical protein
MSTRPGSTLEAIEEVAGPDEPELGGVVVDPPLPLGGAKRPEPPLDGTPPLAAALADGDPAGRRTA